MKSDIHEISLKICHEIAEKRPVVQCITNTVTVNDCANALLAIGASPTMAHHPQEMEDFAKVSDALVCNMGATESFEAMEAAGRIRSKDRPVVIDPVGCAASSFRREKCLDIINKLRPACIRGNAAEIRALVTDRNTAKGVDDIGSENRGRRYAQLLSDLTGCIVIASGVTDYAAFHDEVIPVTGGSAYLTRITGSGCMLSSMLGAFLAVDNSLKSAAACCHMMAACAENAEKRMEKVGGGAGTFHIYLMDALSRYSVDTRYKRI